VATLHSPRSPQYVFIHSNVAHVIAIMHPHESGW
jgi:hypothetical protein